jgi:phage shock protein PspC (stress-responsive transcriptional regulator)
MILCFSSDNIILDCVLSDYFLILRFLIELLSVLAGFFENHFRAIAYHIIDKFMPILSIR